MKDPHLYSWENLDRIAFDCNYSVQNIAKKIGVSRKNLYNKFMFVYDANPVYIVNWMRSIRVRGMLETGYSIRIVMQKLGYKSRSHFTRDCLKWHKINPKNLQQKESLAKKRNKKIVDELCRSVNNIDNIAILKKILISKIKTELI